MLNRHGFTKLLVEEMKKEGVLPKRKCTIKIAYKFMRSYQKAVIRALTEYGGAKICNWGTYALNTVPGGELVNPHNQKIYKYKETETPKFKFSKTLTRRMNLDCNLDDILGEEMYIKE